MRTSPAFTLGLLLSAGQGSKSFFGSILWFFNSLESLFWKQCKFKRFYHWAGVCIKTFVQLFKPKFVQLIWLKIKNQILGIYLFETSRGALLSEGFLSLILGGGGGGRE